MNRRVMAAKFLSTKIVRRLKALAIPAVLIAALVAFFPNYAKLNKLRQENVRLNRECRKLEEEITEYQGNFRKLGHDPYLYEKIARDSLGIARQDELVVDIEE